MTTREARKSKGLYCKWTEEDLKKALEAIKEGMQINEAARRFNIPPSTLKRYNKAKAPASIVNIGRPTDLPNEVEEELVHHLLHLERMFYGFSRKGVMQLAYEIARRNNLKTRFSHDKKTAGKEWFSSFMRRHPEISLRSPQATSLPRASGFNKVVVYKFFDLLEKVVDENKITASRIFNMDETSHTVVQRPEKVVAKRGRHQVGAITTCERGQNVTGVYAFNAVGFYVPPMLIFARKRMKDSLVFGAPPGTIFSCQEKGWMNTEVFCEWMQHFVSMVKPSPEDKVLLILDGHTSHTQSLAAIEMARRHGVIMLSLPAHCTHRMQPLDKGFFRPLNTYMSSAIAVKLRDTPGQPLTIAHIASLVGEAFPRAATMSTAINSFKATGIWPVDRFVFSDADFAPSEVTDHPETSEAASEQTTNHPGNSHLEEHAESAHCAEILNCSKKTYCIPEQQLSPLPSTSGESSKKNTDYIPVMQISPLPSTSGEPSRRKRNRTSASGVLLTGTPHKKTLVRAANTSGVKSKKKIHFGKQEHKSSEETFCVVCGESREEDWIQCNKCKEWAHEDCADISDSVYYFCDRCIVE